MGSGDINLIAKIAPKNDAFVNIVDSANSGIADAGNFFTGVTVEAALQEVAGGTSLLNPYLKKDGSVDLTNNWTIATNSITLTAGTLTANTLTDGTASLTGGNLTSMGNITGADIDISAGTGDYVSSGYSTNKNFVESCHYTGFPNRSDTSISFADGTATLTLTATTDKIWVDGVEYEIDTLTSQLPSGLAAPSGLYWFWITAPGGVPQLNNSTSPTDAFGLCLTATVYWNTTTNAGVTSDERHWFGRDKWWHEMHHETVGAAYVEGMAGSFTDTTFAVGAGEFYDEDIEHENAEETVCHVIFHDGDADWAIDDNSTIPYKVTNPGVDDTLNYNNGNTLTPSGNQKYVNYWVFMTPNVAHPVQVVIGTAQWNTATGAQTEGLPSLGVLPTAENLLIYRLTYRNLAGTPSLIDVTDFRGEAGTGSGGFVPVDHGGLAGLTDDDHPQYFRLDQSTPQTITASPIFDWGTEGGIPFYSATKTLTNTTNFVWDNTKELLTITGTVGNDQLSVVYVSAYENVEETALDAIQAYSEVGGCFVSIETSLQAGQFLSTAKETTLPAVYIKQMFATGKGLQVDAHHNNFSGTIESTQFITTGGASTDFVKGDGTLDGSTYITGVAWNEITGDQSDINLSGFTNDSGFITSSYTNLTSFVDQTAWRLFYSNTDGDVTELAFGDATKVLTSNGATSAPTWETAGGGTITHSTGITIDGSGSVLTTGTKGYFRVPYSGTIKSWSLTETSATPTSSTIVIDIWKDTTGNFPPTNADSITNGHEPTITTATNAVDVDLSDWTSVTVTAGDYLAYNIDSVTNAKRVTLVLEIEQS